MLLTETMQRRRSQTQHTDADLACAAKFERAENAPLSKMSVAEKGPKRAHAHTHTVGASCVLNP